MAVVLQDLVDALEVVVRVSVGGVARPFREKIGNFDTATQRGFFKKLTNLSPFLKGNFVTFMRAISSCVWKQSQALITSCCRQNLVQTALAYLGRTPLLIRDSSIAVWSHPS